MFTRHLMSLFPYVKNNAITSIWTGIKQSKYLWSRGVIVYCHDVHVQCPSGPRVYAPLLSAPSDSSQTCSPTGRKRHCQISTITADLVWWLFRKLYWFTMSQTWGKLHSESDPEFQKWFSKVRWNLIFFGTEFCLL